MPYENQGQLRPLSTEAGGWRVRARYLKGCLAALQAGSIALSYLSSA